MPLLGTSGLLSTQLPISSSESSHPQDIPQQMPPSRYPSTKEAASILK